MVTNIEMVYYLSWYLYVLLKKNDDLAAVY